MRLIDADKYTENIKNFANSIREKEPKFAAVYDAIINSINRQPTAYDVDNVVRQLKTDSSIKLYGSGNSNNYLIPVNKAIEIVKQGCVGKEVD